MGALDRSGGSTRRSSGRGDTGYFDAIGNGGKLVGGRMRILVTGAAGFLGRALLRTLASRCREDQITALDLAPPSNAEATGQISWVSGALDDRDMMERAGLQDFDVIYHLASVPGALAEREPALGRRVNLDATLDLFERWPPRPKAAGRLCEQRGGLRRHGRTDRSAWTALLGRQALTAPISGWPRLRSRIIPEGASFPELRCASPASSPARESRRASAPPS